MQHHWVAPETRIWIKFWQYLVFKCLGQGPTKGKVRCAGDATLTWEPSISTWRRSRRGAGRQQAVEGSTRTPSGHSWKRQGLHRACCPLGMAAFMDSGSGYRGITVTSGRAPPTLTLARCQNLQWGKEQADLFGLPRN